MTTQKRSLTGIRPSGNLHLGNYLGTIKPGLELQESYHCMYFIADMHALTTTKDPQKLKDTTYDIVASWAALGLDTKRHILYRQSDLPMVTELAWYLSCVTGVGLLEKAHAFKDAASQSKEVNHGVFAYPVLMAADILMYDPDVVPVGKDQKQHVEMARDMAGSFNAAYKSELLKQPIPLINEKVMTIPGLDGRKMSKSYNNEIPLFCDEKTLRKKVMSIMTDSTPVESSKTLKGTLIGDLCTHFVTADQFNALESKLQAGGMGWGNAKEELFIAINEAVKAPREKYVALRQEVSALDALLSEGAQKALEIALPVLNRVRNAVGFKNLQLTVH